MEGSHASSTSSPLSSSLLCKEDKSCLIEEQHLEMGNQLINSQLMGTEAAAAEEEDYIKFLFRRERKTNFGSNNCSSGFLSKTPLWVIDARLDAINWVLNTQTQLGIHNQTAYLSLTYFDRFLSLYPIEEDKPWVFKVLSIACLSLAVKMEEIKSFPLSMFLSKKGYDGFNSQVIQKMEFLVLTILEWNMRLITPFSYLHYFSNKFGGQETKLDQVISRAMELLMAIIKEIRLIDYRPSMIAAGAVLAASDLQLTNETLKCKVSTLSIWDWEGSENQEQLFACYYLMQRLSANGNLGTPNSSEVDRTLLSANTAKVGRKRRLTFSDEDPSLEES